MTTAEEAWARTQDPNPNPTGSYGLGYPPDLLNPPGGEYPHIEFEDLAPFERTRIVFSKIGKFFANMHPHQTVAAQMTRQLEGLALQDISMHTFRAALDQVQFTAVINDTRIKKAQEDFAKANGLPVAARHGHLMATPEQIARYQSGSWKDTYLSEVRFTEPVNAFTCLNGERLAVGGDMITGMTVEPTMLFEDRRQKGLTGAYHKARMMWF